MGWAVACFLALIILAMKLSLNDKSSKIAKLEKELHYRKMDIEGADKSYKKLKLQTNQHWFGVVRKASDGDGLIIWREVKVRLADIDAPEYDQPFGLESKVFLDKISRNKIVKVVPRDVDKHDRLIATVLTKDGVDINRFMVSNGYAFCYDEFCQRPEMAGAETAAMANGLGFWGLESPPEKPQSHRLKKVAI